MGVDNTANCTTIRPPSPFKAMARAAVSLGQGTEAHRALRFLAVGGLAAGVNWGSRFAWSLVLPFRLAVIAAYATGMVVAFVMYRRFVFDGSGSRLAAQIRNFFIVNMLGLSQTWILAVVLVDKVLPAVGWTFQPEACGHTAAIVAPIVTSWFGHRYFTFRSAQAG
jgi:putative flippase GtrA